MTAKPKPKRKHRPLTDKQKTFVREYCTPGKGFNNATQAAILAGYAIKSASIIGCKNIVKVNVRAAINRYRADLSADSRFTREKQLDDLETVKHAAVATGSHAAVVSAIREQNEMLGYHRDTAPNPEREQARSKLIANEIAVLTATASKRTAELSTRTAAKPVASKVISTANESNNIDVQRTKHALSQAEGASEQAGAGDAI